MKFLKIIILTFILNSNAHALDTVEKTTEQITKAKDKSKKIFKTLTRKSLNKEQTINFLMKYVIILNDEIGDGIVTYYFDDKIYTRYKNLEIISQDKWKISSSGKLSIYYSNSKNSWRIQPSKENTINIKKPRTTIGKLYFFSYADKIDFYLELEEKKLKN